MVVIPAHAAGLRGAGLVIAAGLLAPNGCRRCGIERRGHAIQAGADGWHTWTQPTQQQIKARMLARQEARDT